LQLAMVAAILDEKVPDEDLRKLLNVLLDVCGEIAKEFRRSLVTKAGTSNSFGDEQLSVDLIADRLLFERLEKSGLVVAASSEEVPELKPLNGSRFVVNFDPLDGSSIIDVNWAVGTIVGIFDKSALNEDGQLTGATGRQQVASLMATYGPRLTVLVTLSDGVYELMEMDGEWTVTAPRIEIGEKAKIFAPANMRAAQSLPGYKAQIEDWMTRKLTLRYTGGLVPDTAQIFIKKHGVFANPVCKDAPAKLRLLYEVAPIALLVEMAGGASSSGSGSALDVAIKDMDQREAFCVGSKLDVQGFPAMMGL